MTDIIEDLIKIYISSIDSYNSKILQLINEKYTIIDKAMLASYIYIKILEELNINEEASTEALKNYLLKQIIYGETGNLSLEITDKSKENLYNNVIEKLIIEKFEYKNRILKILKYNYKTINNEYSKLLSFCENIAEYCILQKLAETKNSETNNYLIEMKNKFNYLLNTINFSKTPIINEERKILEQILDGNFENSSYNELINIALNLKEIFRYSSLTTTVPENVLFHQYTITVTSIILSEYLNNSLNENIDIRKIIYKSLFHDFSEYKGNEIVTQVKNYNAETIKMFEEMENADNQELESKIRF